MVAMTCQEILEEYEKGLFRSRHRPISVVADAPPRTAAAEDETAQKGRAHGKQSSTG